VPRILSRGRRPDKPHPRYSFDSMRIAHRTPLVRVFSHPLRDADADLLVVPVFEDDDFADLPELDRASDGEVSGARARGELSGALYDLFTTQVSGWTSRRVLAVGAGRRADCSGDRIRRLATTAGLAARQRRLTRIALVHRAGTPVTPQQAAQVLAEGAVLANFEGACYKTDESRGWLETVDLVLGATSAAIEQAAERGRVLGECSNMARALANEPGNRLTPAILAGRAGPRARRQGHHVRYRGHLDQAGREHGPDEG
jgi:leucyl aminopeptidase